MFLVNMRTGERRDMPHLSSRVLPTRSVDIPVARPCEKIGEIEGVEDEYIHKDTIIAILKLLKALV